MNHQSANYMAQVALLNCSVLTGTAWCFHIGIAEAYFPYFVLQCTPIGNGKKEVLYCNDFRFVISFLTNCSIISINERYNPRTSCDAHRTVVESRAGAPRTEALAWRRTGMYEVVQHILVSLTLNGAHQNGKYIIVISVNQWIIQ